MKDQTYFFSLYRNGFYWKLKNLIKNLLKPNLPISTPKYKNLFCQTWKNVGSYTRVFTVPPNGLFVPNKFFRPKTISKVAIIKTTSATIAFSFSHFLFLC